MKVVIVLGKKPSKEELRAGTISPQFKQAIELGSSLLNVNRKDRLIISGGVTTPGYLSEAQMGKRHLPFCYNGEVLTEDQSLNTAENIRFSRDLVHTQGIEPDEVIIVTSHSHAGRAKLHMKRRWPDMASKTSYRFVAEKSKGDTLFQRIGYMVDFFHLGGFAFAVMKMIGMKN